MNKMIQFEQVAFAYDQHNQVLRNVNFVVNQQEFVALIGPNGSGKSTILKLLLQEMAVQEGSITLFNENQNAFKQWDKIGYVAQHVAAIYQNFPASVFEVIYMSSKKKDKKKVHEVLFRVGMEKYAKRLVSTLSGGQIQRVAIARVLINAPAILILDEPTTGIDKATTLKLYALLKKLTEEKTTVLMVTHDLAGCKDYISKALCLEEGHVCTLTKAQIELELAHKHQHQVE